MNSPSDQSQDWDSCDAGYLVGLSTRAKTARRKQTALRAGAGMLAVLCAVGLGMWINGSSSQPQEDFFGGIACHEVQENMPAFLAGTLPGELQQRIEAHLLECPECESLMQQMIDSQAESSLWHDPMHCDCSACQRQATRLALKMVRKQERNSPRSSATLSQLALAN